jgi:hypothetical protein
MTAFNPNTPYGLSPVQRNDGAVWSDRGTIYYVPAAQTNALYVGDPVIKKAGSADTNGTNGCDLAVAGTGNSVTGVVIGFLGACTAGLNKPSLYGLPAGPVYRPASTAQDWFVIVNDDPEAQWNIQVDSNVGGTIAVTFSAAAAITGTGLPSTAGTPVAFSNSTASTDLPSPYVAYQTYYVLPGSTSTSITVAATPGGTAIVAAGAGTGSSFITSGVPFAVATVGKNINLLPGTGNPYTGWSGWQASSGANVNIAGATIAAPGTGSTLQLNVLGVATDAGDAAGAFFTKLRVRLNTATEITGQSGI